MASTSDTVTSLERRDDRSYQPSVRPYVIGRCLSIYSSSRDRDRNRKNRVGELGCERVKEREF